MPFTAGEFPQSAQMRSARPLREEKAATAEYQAGVEAVRWFVFALIGWLTLNTLSRERLPLLALCVHVGAVIASGWAAWQFWGNLDLFPQGPQPASTFVNRNFFAEYAVCTLPFSAWLLAREGVPC